MTKIEEATPVERLMSLLVDAVDKGVEGRQHLDSGILLVQEKLDNLIERVEELEALNLEDVESRVDDLEEKVNEASIALA